MIRKKAVGPVVATALLLVVAVVGVVTFQTWFNTYSSSLQNEVETQSSSELGTRVERVVGDNLYFRNGGNENISITDIEVEGVSCNVSQNISSGTQSIDIRNCVSNLTTSTPEVVVYTDNNIYSEKIFVDSTSSNSGNSGGSFSLDCSTLPGEWSAVPGNSELGTNDFCVMTYEAKDVGGTPTSQPSLTPWVNINQTDARQVCSNLGSGYHLITDAQWVTMARNAENIGANWDSGTVGQGSMWRGHTDSSPDNALSVSNTSDHYDQTGNSYPSIERRVLELSTGDVVWDLGGNVYDWTNDTIDDAELGAGSASWYEWTSISGYDSLKPSNSTFNSSNGIGQVYTSTNTNRALRRGGRWYTGIYGGAFTLRLYSGPGAFYEYVGFRCSYVG